MESALVQIDVASRDVGPLAILRQQERDYASRSKAESTKRAYRSDWRDFERWCRSHQLIALPATADTVTAYLTERARDHRVPTLTRRVSAISQAHQLAGFESPTQTPRVRTVMAGIRRALGTACVRKLPAVTDVIRAMIAHLRPGTMGIRDRALLLVGFAGAFRRSELVALNAEDFALGPEGLTITIRRSKTDQEGYGERIGIPYGSNPDTCPVRALQAWLEALKPAPAEPLFRSVNQAQIIQSGRLCAAAVALVVKRYTRAAGLDATQYAGHSLRAGLATAAAAADVSERVIMKQTRHRSVQMVRRYIREGDLFRENAAARIGL
jgi:integrase